VVVTTCLAFADGEAGGLAGHYAAFALCAGQAVGALAADSTTPIFTAFLAGALGFARDPAFSLFLVALMTRRAIAAHVAATVGATVLAVALGFACAGSTDAVDASHIFIAGATLAVASIRAALFAFAIGFARRRYALAVLAFVVRGTGAAVLLAARIHAALQASAIGFANRYALTLRAFKVGRADAAYAEASVITALLPCAVGLTDIAAAVALGGAKGGTHGIPLAGTAEIVELADASLALASSAARSGGCGASVCTAASTAITAFLHTNGVPAYLAAVGVLGADAGFARTAATSFVFVGRGTTTDQTGVGVVA